ncbi:MAG: hypothetical protein QOJ38_1430 [Solirubrobacterales bacterium]|nr:hypothetical protein [Solirubrobacterales bacterium]
MTPESGSGAMKSGRALVTFLLVLAVGFGGLTVVSVGVGLARGGDSLLYGDSLTVPVELSPDAVDLPTSEVGPLPAGARLSGSPKASLEVSDPTSKQMLLRHAMDFGLLALFVAGLWLARGFIGSVMAGDPFGAANIQRLRRLGFLLVIGAPAVALLYSALAAALYNDLPLDQVGDLGVAGFSLPTGALVGGLGAFILAEVFAYGLRLRVDVEGTV